MSKEKAPGRTRAARSACGSRQAVVAQASSDARRRAAVVLEVLGGVRMPSQAAEVLGVSLPRYYQMEERAIGGLVAACEPAGRGPRPNAERRVAALEREVTRLQRESGRHQALARVAQRSLGLPASSVAKPGDKASDKGPVAGKSRRRKRRPAVRALRLAAALTAEPVNGSAGDNSPGMNSAGMNSAGEVQPSAVTL